MIKSIRHKALRNYWIKGQTKGLDAAWLGKLRFILSALDAACLPDEMNLPGFHFHALVGNQSGRYSVRLTGNYRVTFGWEKDAATNIDIEDYH